MTLPEQPRAPGYNALYASFDSPLMQQVRQEAYGEDIGQHSWVTADEVRSDIDRLALTSSTQLVDVGCGPCGPLVLTVRSTGCRGIGVDVSPPALASGLARAGAFGVQDRIKLLEADLNRPLPFQQGAFDAVLSLDVILHLRDRRAFLKEVARVLKPNGKLLFTDAGIITGPISNEEINGRSVNGYTQFVPPGLNEALLQTTGFMLIDQEDRTGNVLRIAKGRLRAMSAHRQAIEDLEEKDTFAQQQGYLETVIKLSERKTLSRMMYFAELVA